MKKLLTVLLLASAIIGFSALQVTEFQRPVVSENNAQPDTALYADTLGTQVEEYFKQMVYPTHFSGVVWVSHDGHPIYKAHQGMANFQTHEQLTDSSVFQLASVSKQFTSSAVMLLYQRGLVQLDSSLQHYIPEFPYTNITIRQLLSHKGGLPCYMHFAEHYPHTATPFNQSSLLQMIIDNQRTLRPDFEAGTHYKYSNTGFALLALLVERISGKPFASFMHDEFFEPIGMRHTTVGRPNNKLTTSGHYPNRSVILPFYQDDVEGDKSVYSTANDMFLWDRALQQQLILKDSTLQLATQNQWNGRQKPTNYGFGWRLRRLPNGEQIHYHTGWYRGYTSLFVRIPQTQSSIIILSNKVNKSFMRSYLSLVELLLHESPHLNTNDTLDKPEVDSLETTDSEFQR